MRVAKRLLQRREPDVINLKQIGKKSENTIEIRAFSSDKQLLALYRTIDKDLIGISIVRKFIESVQEEKIEGYQLR